MMFKLFGRKPAPDPVHVLYTAVVAAARSPALYLECGVPDTVEGRFESLSLHVALVLRRLRDLPAPAEDVAQDFVDRFFADLDAGLREIGIGDVSVPKKMKRLGQAFYSRLAGYDAAFDAAEPGPLADALRRNLIGDDTGSADVGAITTYVRATSATLADADLDRLLSGEALGMPVAAA